MVGYFNDNLFSADKLRENLLFLTTCKNVQGGISLLEQPIPMEINEDTYNKCFHDDCLRKWY